ncbi:MAG: tryptophan 2,3-dioxygenase family protein, partial [Planctomycetota bacterium]
MDYSRLVLKELNYNSYLKIPELLDLQCPISDPPHHDEMFFIIIHQSFELWFKEILHETDLLLAFFREGRISRVLKVIKRVNAILGLLVRKIELLNTLTPVEFAGFRERLRPASGFQSVQFREIEFAFGLREEFFFRFFQDDPFALERLRRRFEAPSVRDEFLAALAADGYPVPRETLEGKGGPPRRVPPGLIETLCRIYTQPGDQYHWTLVFEALLDL